MRNETWINTIPFKDIPLKSPDVSLMDYCAFELLKQALHKSFQNIGWNLEDCSGKKTILIF